MSYALTLLKSRSLDVVRASMEEGNKAEIQRAVRPGHKVRKACEGDLYVVK